MPSKIIPSFFTINKGFFYFMLFRQHLVDKRTYFEKLKVLVAREELAEFVLKLF